MAFKARPVVGGHFAFLALERACGGEAVEALSFLDDEPAKVFDMGNLANREFVEEKNEL